MVSLASCCDIVSGATPKRENPKFWGGPVAWATPKDISNLDGNVLEDTPEHLSEEGYRSCSATIIPKGSILFSSRAPIGLVAIAGRDMCTNQGFKSLIPKGGLNNRYLFWCMRHFASKVASMGRGATFKEVSKEVMERVEIPIPDDKDIQRGIADILDLADKLRRKQLEADQLADDYLQSAFHHMFGDPAENKHSFPMGRVRDFVASANYGTAKKSMPTGAYAVLRMGNITQFGGWNFSSLKYTDLSSDEVEKFTVVAGDMLFNRTNSRDLVGKTAVFREDKRMAYAGYLVRVRFNGNADAEYVSAYLNSPHGKSTLNHMCKNIVGMANINAQEMQDIPILKPPVTLQRRFRDIAHDVLRIKKKQEVAIAQANESFGALSQQLFG